MTFTEMFATALGESIGRAVGEQVRTANEEQKFLRLLGPEAVHKAYQHAAKQHHPDRGGDAERMRELNSTWASLKGVYAS